MKVGDITSVIEAYAPLSLQEDFDNSGLNVGNPESEVSGILLCVDVTEAVLDEAIALGANLIVSSFLAFRSMPPTPIWTMLPAA